MSKRNGELLRSAREHVFALFRSAQGHVNLEYHQFARTGDVARACREIAKESDLADDEREVALLCAWFYDACHATGSDDHRKSLELCLQFLEAQQAPRPARERIAACFDGADGVDRRASAAGGALPGGDAACDVLHDARLAVLASEDYVEQAALLRRELERRSGTTFSDAEWTRRCIAYFDAHPYRTRYAQVAYRSQRAANLVRLQKALQRQQRDLDRRADERAANKVGKTVENIYYHFTRIQVGLVGLADHRTSTMIHVNAIMMSLVVALLARRIETDRDLLLPTALLLVVNLTVVFLSVYSMRSTLRLNPEEASQIDSNLITFSMMKRNHLSLSEYRERMSALIKDPAEFERRVVDHLYFGRKLLADRGRALRLTYAVFIYGVTAAMVAFVIALARR